MRRFKLLSAAVLLGCSTLSFAQTSADVEAWKGFRFSFDHAFMNSELTDEDVWGVHYPEKGNGFSVGYEQAFKVAKKVPLFIQTGLGMNMLMFKRERDMYDGSDYYHYETKAKMLSLSVPINLVYGIRVNDALTIKPYTGFYLRANLFGKGKYDYSWVEDNGYDGQGSGKVNLFEEYGRYEEFDDEHLEKMYPGGAFKRVQFGWQIGATMDIRKFNVGIGYALDLNKLAPQIRYFETDTSPYEEKEIEKSYKMGKLFVRVGFNF